MLEHRSAQTAPATAEGIVNLRIVDTRGPESTVTVSIIFKKSEHKYLFVLQN